MSASKDAQNLTKIRIAVKQARLRGSRPTLFTVVRETGLNIGVVQRLVRKYHLDVAWRARETIEAEANSYMDAIEQFHEFCEEKGVNWRRGMVAALRAFKAKHV